MVRNQEQYIAVLREEIKRLADKLGIGSKICDVCGIEKLPMTGCYCLTK